MKFEPSENRLRARLARGGRNAALLALLAAPLAAQAEVAAVSGMLSNFDVINHTGEDAYGFEIELQGITPDQVAGTFTYQRYGVPETIPTPAGVTLRWASPANAAGAYATRTLPHVPNTPFPGTCYMGGAGYDTSGCEHFGVQLTANPSRTTYRWLVLADPANPLGGLRAVDPPSAVAAPVYLILPPIRVGQAPELRVEVEAPEPPEAPERYGDAQWVKVFKVDSPRDTGLNELLSDNAAVPRDAARLEVSWDLIQADPPAGTGGKQKRGRKGYQGGLNAGTRSVVRTIELYDYTGAYDPLTHEALCADTTCAAPAPGEVGDMISRQMTAANVVTDWLTVAKTGGGNVDSADKLISCGNKCAATYNNGFQVSLTAKPASGSVFSGWSGACAGTAATCTVAVTGPLTVNAAFAAAPTNGGGGGTSATLAVKTAGGKGAITSAPAGINCGKTCAAGFAAGAAVSLTATPEAGFRFVNWSGACAGTAPTCNLTVNGALTAQANFAK